MNQNPRTSTRYLSLALCATLILLCVTSLSHSTVLSVRAATADSPSDAPSIATLPATGPLKIVTLGDSLTEGQGDDDGNGSAGGGYPARLATMIEAVRPGSKIVNLGHSGWDSTALINGDQGLPGELKQAVKENPDLAIVWIGSNDLWYSVYGEEDQPAIDTFTANIDTILRTLTEKGAVVYIALLDDQTLRPYATHADSGYSKNDLKRMSTLATTFNKIILSAAAEYGAYPVDFFHTTIFTDPETLYDDGNHPNKKGYDEISNIWYKAIEPALTGQQLPAPTLPVE